MLHGIAHRIGDPQMYYVNLAGTDALVASIIGQSTSTSLSAKAAADAMALKTANDAKAMGELTKQLSIQRTLDSKAENGYLQNLDGERDADMASAMADMQSAMGQIQSATADTADSANAHTEQRQEMASAGVRPNVNVANFRFVNPQFGNMKPFMLMI